MNRDFFYPALGHDRFHGCPGAAAIHVRGGRTNTLGRTFGIGKQPAGVAMFAPQSAQCLIRQVGQRDETILMALAAPEYGVGPQQLIDMERIIANSAL